MIGAAGLDWLSGIRSGRAEGIAQRITDQTQLATAGDRGRDGTGGGWAPTRREVRVFPSPI